MYLKQRIKAWIAQFWDTQVDAINDTLAEIDVAPVVIRNKRELWLFWAKFAIGAAMAAALFYLALTHTGGTP